jgi:hypothetical protein
MKLATVLLGLLVTLPAASAAQTASSSTTLLDRIKANVALTAGAEKERWTANVQLWDLKLAQKDRLSAAELGMMKASLDQIKANVANVLYAPEKERWEANIALWQATFDNAGQLSPAAVATMKGSLAVIRANVAKITEMTEKERWEANRDLWTGVLGR